MANIPIRQIPGNLGTPNQATLLAMDNGIEMQRANLKDLVFAGRPSATAQQAIDGADTEATMTPFATAQAITAQGTQQFATASQGQLAASAVQPSRIIGAGTGLVGGGNLSSDRTIALNQATQNSLTLANSAVQPGALGALASKNTVSNADWSGADLALENGGTGASTAAAARNNLGLGSAAVSDASAFATAAQGVPAGGVAGQTLTKTGPADFAFAWSTPAGGGDMLKSVYDPTNRSTDIFAEVDELKGQPLVVVVSGQSNADILRSYTWTPAKNVKVWNWRGIYATPPQGDNDVGSGFIALEPDTISWGRSLANEVGRANPGRDVYLVNVGWSSQDISHWLPGTTSPDVYNALKINVEAALAAIGVNRIDVFAFWQGESDALAGNAGWVSSFETLMTRLKNETWFPYATPVVISGFSPYDNSGSPTAIQRWEDQLRLAAWNDPELRSYVSYEATPSSLWASNEGFRHATAEGYRQTGAVAFQVLSSGANSGKNTYHSAKVSKRQFEERASSTTVVNDTELFAQLRAGKTYRFSLDLIGFAQSTGGFKWTITGPAAQAILVEYQQTIVGVGASAAEGNINAVVGYPANVALAGTGYIRLRVDGIVRNCSANGLLRLAWSQNASNATPTAVNEGSRFEIEEIPRVV